MTEESFGWVAEKSCLYIIFDSVWVRLYKLPVVVGSNHLKWGVGIGVDECLGQLGVGLVPFELERCKDTNYFDIIAKFILNLAILFPKLYVNLVIGGLRWFRGR